MTGPPENEFKPGNTRNLYQLPSGGPSYVISLCSEMKFSHLSGAFPEASDLSLQREILNRIAIE